jgi:hypothetical protein
LDIGHTAVIPALKRLKHRGPEFDANLAYTVRPCLKNKQKKPTLYSFRVLSPPLLSPKMAFLGVREMDFMSLACLSWGQPVLQLKMWDKIWETGQIYRREGVF